MEQPSCLEQTYCGERIVSCPYKPSDIQIWHFWKRPDKYVISRSSQSSEKVMCYWFAGAGSQPGRRFLDSGISDQMMFWQSCLAVWSFGPWSPPCVVLHVQSTMADIRAMTATPENMRRICSSDCLESRWTDISITKVTSQQQRMAGNQKMELRALA